MDKAQFWLTIEKSRKEDGSDDSIFLANLKQALGNLPASDIAGFQAYLNIYMEAMNFPAMREVAKHIKTGCTDDGFEYFRAWLVSQGKDVFYKAFENPDTLYGYTEQRLDSNAHSTKCCELEDIIYCSFDPYKDVTGRDEYGEFYQVVSDLEFDIATEICRDLACDECMKSHHVPENMESAEQPLDEQCCQPGDGTKDICIWQKHYPDDILGPQM